jgi:hypothetical protein
MKSRINSKPVCGLVFPLNKALKKECIVFRIHPAVPFACGFNEEAVGIIDKIMLGNNT